MSDDRYARFAGPRRERILASAQFEDGAFANRYAPLVSGEVPRVSMASAMLDMAKRDPRRTPARPFPVENPQPAWAGQADTGLRVTWLGHSTTLIEMDGVRVLTDPVWAQRASPFSFLGPKRFQPVPIALDALPALDAVLISHDHYDHLDRQTVLALARRCRCFVTSLGVGHRLEAWGIPGAFITELDWWESTTLARGLTITAAPAHHFSGRGLRDRNTALWSSFAFRSARHALFFSGDTGLSAAFDDIGKRLGPFDLVMLEVGAHHPAWHDMHLGPENARKAWSAIGSGVLLPIHWGTFALAAHAWDDPAEVLLAQMPEGALLMPRLGQAVEPGRAPALEPWWRPSR